MGGTSAEAKFLLEERAEMAPVGVAAFALGEGEVEGSDARGAKVFEEQRQRA